MHRPTVFNHRLLFGISLLLFASAAVAQQNGSRGFHLESTVGLDPQNCSQTADLALPEGGGEVIVCLRASNYERSEYVLHDLLSEELGVLVTDLHYTLSPRTSTFYTFAVNVSNSTGFTSAWIARGLTGELACEIAWSVVTVGQRGLTRDEHRPLICP